LQNRRLAKAFKEVRRKLGYATAERGYRAQQSLSYAQFTDREKGRIEWAVGDLIVLAHEWGLSPAELFCLWVDEYDGSTFAPLAEKTGLSIGETKRRFERKQSETGLSFEQLFLLAMKDQITL